ncbi:unnamed protein product [Aphanomyces euteiches]
MLLPICLIPTLKDGAVAAPVLSAILASVIAINVQLANMMYTKPKVVPFFRQSSLQTQLELQCTCRGYTQVIAPRKSSTGVRILGRNQGDEVLMAQFQSLGTIFHIANKTPSLSSQADYLHT